MSSRFLLLAALGVLLCLPAYGPARAADDAQPLPLTLRSREKVAGVASPGPVYSVSERAAQWDPKHTAVILIDVWDKHWCDGANRRLAAMIPRMDQFVSALRGRGVFVIHAPSDTMKTYEGAPGRMLAQHAPAAPVPAGVEFKWNYCDPKVEGDLPIDDTDGGCDCQPQCKTYNAWKGEHPGIHISPGDAISADGREVWNLLQQRGIDNVIVCGVHANMCILGRPFGIRELRKLGKNVVLVRDLTDTMYNPRKKPFVPHERGTDLLIEHVEKNWCPTITSEQVLALATGGDASAKGQAAAGRDRDPNIVFVLAEDEYDAKKTMPAFASEELEKRFGWKPVLLQSDSKTDLPGTEAIEKADLLVLFMRRRELQENQLKRFKAYFDAGKPVVGVRTASHSFQNWLEFDKLVLGCNYGRHYGTGKEGEQTAITLASKSAADHPILRGISFDGAGWNTNASLYRVTPLFDTATPLLKGKWRTEPEEPVAWTNTHNGGRVFYTSLGHPDDFKDPHFRRLLLNGILWALDKPIPKGE
jgi:type 1 glutamine amidotransferase/nicotinamidase-related amidase